VSEEGGGYVRQGDTWDLQLIPHEPLPELYESFEGACRNSLHPPPPKPWVPGQRGELTFHSHNYNRRV
jgi:hypothetical protein